jgi:ABC-2 type transport system permease protein
VGEVAGSRVWRILSEPYASLKGIVRYKETLFWVVIFPLLWYGLMVAIWGAPSPPKVEVAVYNGDPLQGNGTIGDALVRAMNESGLFKLALYNDSERILDAVRHGRVGAGVIVPGNFTESLEEGRRAVVGVVYEESRRGSYAYGVVAGFLESFADSLRSRAVNMPIYYLSSSRGYPGWNETYKYAVQSVATLHRGAHNGE